MPLALARDPKDVTFRIDISVWMPNEAGGQTKCDFAAKCRYLPQSRVKEMQEGKISDLDFLREAVVEYQGIVDKETKESLGPVDDQHALIAEYGGVVSAISAAYFRAINGIKTKN